MNNIEAAQLLLNRLRLSSVAYIDTQYQQQVHPEGRHSSLPTSLGSPSSEFRVDGSRVNQVCARGSAIRAHCKGWSAWLTALASVASVATESPSDATGLSACQ